MADYYLESSEKDERFWKQDRDAPTYVDEKSGNHVRKVFFESEKARIPYENGRVIPKDFEKYEADLQGLIDYVDMVSKNPLESSPAAGLDEIAKLKDTVIFTIENIDAYFSEGGTFHEKELQRLRDYLDGRLYMLKRPITKLGNLLRKVNAIK